MRQEFPAKIKLAAFERANGRCEIPGCNAKLHPGRFIYDHRNPDYFGGEPTLENCQVICRECDRDKTNKDASDIAKSRRIIKREAGIRRRRRWGYGRDDRFKKKVTGEVVERMSARSSGDYRSAK